MSKRARLVRKSTKNIIEDGLGAMYSTTILYRLHWVSPL